MTTLQATRQTTGKWLDPRTKIFILIAINIFLMRPMLEGISTAFKLSVILVPCLLLYTFGKRWLALFYTVLFIAISAINWYFRVTESSFMSLVILAISNIILWLAPGLILGWYLVVTTTVSEFIASMTRMRMPAAITIAFAVMFRFFPTLVEEYKSIRGAMHMRNIRFSLPTLVDYLEYQIVPLLMSLVKIGEELTAAALTRGLHVHAKRTNVCQIGMGLIDYALIVFVSSMIVAHMILVG